MKRTDVLTPPAPFASGRRTTRERMDHGRAEARQRQGRALVVAGWVAAVVGVVLYCVASFAADADADLAAIVLHGAVPAARAALVIVGCGTLLWIIGSVMHVNALLDAAEAEDRAGEDARR